MTHVQHPHCYTFTSFLPVLVTTNDSLIGFVILGKSQKKKPKTLSHAASLQTADSQSSDSPRTSVTSVTPQSQTEAATLPSPGPGPGHDSVSGIILSSD